MCFPRKPGLGLYNASREEWLAAYRSARLTKNYEADPMVGGIRWKAALIVLYERQDYNDLLLTPLFARLASKHAIDELLSNTC